MEGDKVLRTLGRVLRENIRDTDAAFRYGGEEFVVLLPETDLTEAMAMAERIRSAFAASGVTGGTGAVGPTVSIGAAQYIAGEQLPQCISRADQAMYEAKRSGKDRIFAAC
jgi:diguanylate cyclase (GGDEF)-like protein